MFNGFPTTVTPSAKIWDYSKPTAGSLSNPNVQIALTSDCAEFNLIYVGSAYYPVQVTLPQTAAVGKKITIKVENIGNISTNNGVYVYDPAINIAGNSTNGLLIAKLGFPCWATFVYVPQSEYQPNSPYSSGAWVVYGSSNSQTQSGNYTAPLATSFGEDNQATGYASFVAGSGNKASSTTSMAIGNGNTVSSLYGCALGVYQTVDGSASVSLAGMYGTTKGITNCFTSAGDGLLTFLALGAAQKFSVVLGCKTTDATATVLRSNTSAAGTTNQYILRNNAASIVKGTIIAGVTGAGNTSGWTFEAVIKRGASAAATSIVQSVINLSGQDSGASGWTVAIAADTTNGGLSVTVTGQASTNINWVCLIEATETCY